MAYILSAEKDNDRFGAFPRYRDYVSSAKATFPPQAYELASSEWYFDPKDHRCPHDAWLESLVVSEPSTGSRQEIRHTTIRVRLLGAYHDGFIELVYPKVFSYQLTSPLAERGLGDWRYDEFRVDPSGHVIHEVEWAGFGSKEASRWIIEASDLEFHWIPK